jgi:riboflavin kinase/FMN adenylyltransferase
MSVYRIRWDEPAPEECLRAVVTIGNFDGVHLGHASLLARLRAQARRLRVPAVAMTFDPHPLRLLRPERYQPTLTTPADRAGLLHEAGADHVLILHTSPELLQLSAADFFDRVIRRNLRAGGLVEGPNFAFGHNREGDVEMLARLCAQAGLVLEIVPPLQLDGGIVSTSRVRDALSQGQVGTAQRWLGRPYRLTGTVGGGQRRGQQLGFPTANLTHIDTLIPGDGVYAARAAHGPPRPQGTGDGPPRPQGSFPAAVNIGPNPTFGEQERKLEVHLIGFQGDLYGQLLTVEFLARIRDTRRFESLDLLKTQIQSDVARARELAS